MTYEPVWINQWRNGKSDIAFTQQFNNQEVNISKENHKWVMSSSSQHTVVGFLNESTLWNKIDSVMH